MAAEDRGHITQSEKHVLNRQEIAVSPKIGQ